MSLRTLAVSALALLLAACGGGGGGSSPAPAPSPPPAPAPAPVPNPVPNPPTLACSANGLAAAAMSTQPAVVCMLTSSGEMVFELFGNATPVTVQNFLNYVGSSFYSSTLVHRVEAGFVIQGGGFTSGMVAKQAAAPIVLEDNAGLSNLRGTIAMARTSAPDSATSQWFVNVANNPLLDRTVNARGYAVFGRLISGATTLDAIAATPVINFGPNDNRPATEVLTYWVQRLR